MRIQSQIFLLGVFFTLLFVSYCQPPPSADPRREERETKLNAQGNNKYTITSQQKGNNGTRNSFVFTLQSNPNWLGAILQAKTKDSDSKDAFSFRVRFAAIQEYFGPGSFIPGQSQKGVTYFISDKGGNRNPDLSPASPPPPRIGIMARTKDGIFTLNITAAPVPVNLTKPDGKPRPLLPASVKIDIGIERFPYSTNRNDSKLALVAEIKSIAPLTDNADKNDDPRVKFGANAGPRGFFNWDNSSRAIDSNGSFVDVPVLISGLRPPNATGGVSDDIGEGTDPGSDSGGPRLDESVKVAFFSFDIVRPIAIIWDPEAGVESFNADSTTTGNGSSVISYSAVSILLLGVFALFAQRM